MWDVRILPIQFFNRCHNLWIYICIVRITLIIVREIQVILMYTIIGSFDYVHRHVMPDRVGIMDCMIGI